MKRERKSRAQKSRTKSSVGWPLQRSKFSELRTPMADMRSAYQSEYVTHPGEMVLDYLDFNGWSQSDLARRTGLTPKTISEICNGKAAITPPTSLALEKVLQRPAHFWLNLQRRFDEAQERAKSK